MDLVQWNDQMALFIKETGAMVNHVDMALLHMLMEMFMKANGKYHMCLLEIPLEVGEM